MPGYTTQKISPKWKIKTMYYRERSWFSVWPAILYIVHWHSYTIITELRLSDEG